MQLAERLCVSSLPVMRWPTEVGRLMLVASAGFEETWLALSRQHAPVYRALIAWAKWLTADGDSWSVRGRYNPLRALLAHLNLVSHTPQFGVSSSIAAVCREHAIPLTMISGQLDILHTPHHNRMGQNKSPPPDSHFVLLPWADHVYLCAFVSRLRLWRHAHYWAPASPPKAAL